MSNYPGPFPDSDEDGRPDRPPNEGDDMRKWELSTADDEDRGTFTGNRAAAVAEANRRTAETGTKTYVQPAGTTVTTTAPKS